jgi:hypothetical protein
MPHAPGDYQLFMYLYREEDQELASGVDSLFGEYALQESTGSRGYFGNAGSIAETLHMMKTEPRSDAMRRALRHEEHSPALSSDFGGSAMPTE